MPKTIKLALVIVFLKIASCFLLLAIAHLTVYHKADHGFWLGMQKALGRQSGAESLEAYNASDAWYFSGKISFYLTLNGLLAWTFLKRWFIACILFTAFIGLAVLGSHSLPLGPALLIILICSRSGRSWLMRKPGVPPVLGQTAGI
jgi:hypothetical protein